MAAHAIRMFKYFIGNSLESLPFKIVTIQSLMTNSILYKTQFGTLMARPYELIEITNSDIQIENKIDR
jgi:hypothetical protein